MNMRPAFIPENQSAIGILKQFKKHHCYFGIIIAEFGPFEGIITLHNLATYQIKAKKILFTEKD